MTTGNLAWWHAMVGAAQFEDGSLVIQDDTLDVTGGGTVNLLVKLGARPRSDVTVALSETSALISLGSTSLTFTPDNWDTFQSVAVTAAGNRQAISLPSTAFSRISTLSSWNLAIPRPQLNSGFAPSGTSRFLVGCSVLQNGGVNVNFGPANNSDAVADLTSAFEANGSLRFDAGSDSLTVALAGADPSDPYNWTPTNSSAVTAFHNALDGFSGTATLTLRDYTPGDATISLSASGPAEYTGVTGSAAISVT